ncbi:hypothetical protein QUF58_03610 [Anaerolineales bacterium HSG24]|nr:hypothetical protein [Anaerolineales bacterium HSG24]
MTELLRAVFDTNIFVSAFLSRSSEEKRTIIHLKLPEKIISNMEELGLIHYGPFYPMSEAGYTETIFEVSSFPIINQYRHLWYTN